MISSTLLPLVHPPNPPTPPRRPNNFETADDKAPAPAMAIAINDVIKAFFAMMAIPAMAKTARAANFNFKSPNNGNNFFIIFFFVRPSTTKARTDSFTSSGMALARLRPALEKSQLIEPNGIERKSNIYIYLFRSKR